MIELPFGVVSGVGLINCLRCGRDPAWGRLGFGGLGLHWICHCIAIRFFIRTVYYW